jgi:hypothetical protein
MKAMPAHKVNGGQFELARALHAVLGAEEPSLRLDLHDLVLHLLNVLHVLIHLSLALLYHLILLLQSFKQILSKDFELKVLFGLDNFKNEEGRQDFVIANNLEGFLEIGLRGIVSVAFFQVSEKGQSLDPKVCQVGRSTSPTLLLCGVSGAYFKYLLSLFILNIVAEKLLLKVKPLTAALNSIGIIVNLEEEEHVMLIHLGVIAFNEGIDLFHNLVLGAHHGHTLDLNC